MKLSELYAMTPESERKGIEGISGRYYDHVPECFGDISSLMYSDGFCERVTTKYVKHFNFDHRRYWRLATVWFDDEPVMVIQNAGREGDDHAKRFITNAGLFGQMVQYIDAQCAAENEVVIEQLDADLDIDGLDSFYGNSLSDFQATDLPAPPQACT